MIADTWKKFWPSGNSCGVCCRLKPQAYVGVSEGVGEGAGVGGAGGAGGISVTSATVQIGPSTVTTESAIQTSLLFTQQIFHQFPARLRPTTVTVVPISSRVTSGYVSPGPWRTLAWLIFTCTTTGGDGVEVAVGVAVGGPGVLVGPGV